VLSSVQIDHRYHPETRGEDLEERSVCVRDEAHDGEQEGEATSQGSVMSMEILSINLEVTRSTWGMQSAAFGVIGG
jgi:hypothetical protein